MPRLALGHRWLTAPAAGCQEPHCCCAPGRPIPGIRVWHAPRLHVHADEPLEVTLDGEILGTLPGDFEVAGEALRVITPLDFDD